MKPNILKRLSALAMTAVMAFSISGGVSAADAATATIDTSRGTSLTIYKYDLTGAENDGVWDSQSYVSTGLADEQVNTALNQYAIQGVEFSYTLVEKGRINKRGKAVFDLAINPSKAEIVQLIFDLYANEGYGSQRISHYLFHKGVIGRSGTNIPNTTIKFSQELLSSLLDEATEKAQEAQAQLKTYQKEYQSLMESSSGLEQEYHQILSWADLYDHCPIAKRKMIVSQLIKAVYVRRDYEITVEFNISFDDFHTLEYHEKAAP